VQSRAEFEQQKHNAIAIKHQDFGNKKSTINLFDCAFDFVVFCQNKRFITSF
jgi:hypothetical protein